MLPHRLLLTFGDAARAGSPDAIFQLRKWELREHEGPAFPMSGGGATRCRVGLLVKGSFLQVRLPDEQMVPREPILQQYLLAT